MLFKRPFFIGCLLVGLLSYFSFFFHIQIRPSDITQYKELTQERLKLRSTGALEQYPTCQIRENIQKDIWTSNLEEGRHFRLISAHSKLFLKQKKDKVEAIEELENLSCFIEEKGAIQTLKALSGAYSYPSHRFVANTVHIEQADRFSIHSDTAELTFQNKTEEGLLEMKGNVRLFSPCIQDKESFSLADKLFVHLDDQTLVLSADTPKRVLFWQEGFSLSAPEIIIQRDPLTKNESIKSKGDAHFTFNLEEQNIIDQLISKYL